MNMNHNQTFLRRKQSTHSIKKHTSQATQPPNPKSPTCRNSIFNKPNHIHQYKTQPSQTKPTTAVNQTPKQIPSQLLSA